jgi:predicted nucleic acid-binding protein
MAKTQIEIQNENAYQIIKMVMDLNKVDSSNREKVINKALSIAADCIINLDEDSLINLTGLKKSI